MHTPFLPKGDHTLYFIQDVNGVFVDVKLQHHLSPNNICICPKFFNSHAHCEICRRVIEDAKKWYDVRVRHHVLVLCYIHKSSLSHKWWHEGLYTYVLMHSSMFHIQMDQQERTKLLKSTKPKILIEVDDPLLSEWVYIPQPQGIHLSSRSQPNHPSRVIWSLNPTPHSFPLMFKREEWYRPLTEVYLQTQDEAIAYKQYQDCIEYLKTL